MANSLICVDASFVVRLLVDAQDTIVVTKWVEWDQQKRQIIAPSLLHYEVVNAVYQYHRHGYLSAETTRDVVETAQVLPIQIYPGSDLHQSATRLAQNFSLSATYDAHYLALADKLGAALWTADRKLVTAVKEKLPWVHLLPEENEAGGRT